MSKTEASDPLAGAYDAFRRGIELWREGADRQAAVSLLEEVLDGRHGQIDRPFAQRVLSRLLIYASRMSWPQTERLARRAIELCPDEAFAHRHFGEALLRQGRTAEAQTALRRAIDLEPEDEDARVLLMLAQRDVDLTRPRMRPRTWPDRRQTFEDPRGMLERYLLRGCPGQPFITPDTVFMTLGSCFADNLARRLAAAGHKVNCEFVGEDINSTYANKCLLQWIEHGPVDGPTRVIDEVYGPARRERLRTGLRSSDVVVTTLGVAPCFFDRRTGEFAISSLKSTTGQEYLAEHCVMRTTTVAENRENLLEMLAAAERIAGRRPRFVVTVSPVALGGTTEFYSAVIADCLSKSTLRLACEEAIRARPDIIYWPSFEIVRWLGVHFTREAAPVFGAEDGNTRHVSDWLVDLIVSLFIEHHSVRPQS